MSEQSIRSTIKGIGVFGSLLYCTLLGLVLWRTYLLLTRNKTGVAITSAKKCFHGFLVAAVFLDFIYYIKLARAYVDVPSYALHLIAIWAELSAFSMVVVQFARVFNAGGEREAFLMKIVALDSFFLVYTFVVIALLFVSNLNTDMFVSSSSQPYLFYFLIQAIILLGFTVLLLTYGFKMQNLIKAHPRWEPLRRERRLRIVVRLNLALFVCSFCFLLRALMLIGHFMQAEAHQQARFLDSGALVSWYIFCLWIPFVVPTCLLLYLMRNNGMGQSGTTATGGGLTLGLAPKTTTTTAMLKTAEEDGGEWEEPLLLGTPLSSSLSGPLVWPGYSPPADKEDNKAFLPIVAAAPAAAATTTTTTTTMNVNTNAAAGIAAAPAASKKKKVSNNNNSRKKKSPVLDLEEGEGGGGGGGEGGEMMTGLVETKEGRDEQ